MIRRSAVAALAVLFLASCEMSTNSPTAPDIDPSAQFAISDGANAGNPFFFFLPPMVKDPDAGGVFDGTKSPVVKICRLKDIADPDGGSCVDGPDLEVFTMSTGIQVNTVDELYHVNWDTDGVAFGEGVVYRIRVYESDAADAAPLGFADVAFPGKGQAKKMGFDTPTIALNDGRTLPIKFRIEEFAYLWEECEPDPSGDIRDCDVRFVPAGAPGTAFVEDPIGVEFAAEVRTPPIGEPVLLTLVLLPNDPPVESPDFRQLPYFVDVTAVNAAGQPVDFGAAGGAELTLCQADGFEEHDYDKNLLRLFRVDDGGPPQIWEDFELTDACYPTASQVALLDSHGHPTGHSRFDVLMDRGKRALASLLLPQPLHAVHGGLNGRGIGDFSTWGATLVDPPPSSVIDFETLPGGIAHGTLPTAVSDQYASLGVGFSFTFASTDIITPGEPWLCDSGSIEGEEGSNISVALPAGESGCWNFANNGTITMTFPGTPGEVRFRLRRIVTPNFSISAENGQIPSAPLTPDLTGLVLHTVGPYDWQTQTVTVVDPTNGVSSIDVVSPVGGGLILIDNLEIISG